MLCLFIFGANGQENIRENHIKLKNDSSRILFDKVCMPFNKTDLLLPNPNAKDVETAIDNTNFKADRPFYIPLYYINPTPMFYGDYSTSGHIFSHFYGSGSQTTLLGIGRINEASIMFHHPVSYTHLRAHETGRNLVCRLLLEKKKKKKTP